MAVENNLLQVDPLQNDEILEQIFKSLPLEDLLSCRQVCKAWRRESGKVMRLRAKVVLDQERSRSAIQEFLELVQSKESIFAGKPFVSNYTVQSRFGTMINIPAEFWKVCGSSIKTLHVSNTEFSTDDDFRDAIFRSCPNLEKLCLENVRKADAEVRGLFLEPKEWVPPRFPQNWKLKSLRIIHIGLLIVPWMEILAHFPALEDLDIKRFQHPAFGMDWIFRSLALARMHDDQCWKLKSLAIKLLFSVNKLPIISLLETGNLALENLNIEGCSRHLSLLERILNAQTGSLKKLSLEIWKNSQTPEVVYLLPLENVFLEKIEELELFNMPISSLKFLRSVPNLKRLTLGQIVSSFEEDDFDEDDWVNQNCTELEFHLITASKTDGLRRLQRRLPNVETLKISDIDNEEFGLVCELWQGLTFLQISGSKVSDAGISGLDEQDVKRINRRREAGNWRPITVPRANIPALKGLKSFRWEGDNKFRLDYCAAICGIQELPQLRHVRMDDYPKFDWNRVCNQFPWNQ